ncbi:hypothetical protein [Planktothrix agardhii]|jgi:hypothetical protein|uniref:Uncharacterized protein n=1 Tax=Planktothrix agardhii TaxID=1160 RepID=A0AAD1V5I9_PLAAG|nr:hypothetical protein [Planktothrix agardhii]MCF3576837.1 hypothetical protein [Planktothrix agardhii 1812]MCF3646702.1 hypothetical protein [Planktothrix agardhii 1026]CAD5937887.1 hypothetical protein PANO66_01780 [Planktothrix agardhii]
MGVYDSLNNCERGKTLFIIGAGPQLNLLSDEQINFLENQAAIGVNRVQYKIKTRYFISAYPSEILLAKKMLPASIFIHVRPISESIFPDSDVITIKREIFNKDIGLNCFLSSSNPIIYTKFNVALAATHLAFILGAYMIVYIGVEQRNAIHYYDEDMTVKSQIKKDFIFLEKHDPILNIDHPYATYKNLVLDLEKNIDDLSSSPFYTIDHTDTFREYFKFMRKYGLEIYTTKRDSVVFDAGAIYKSIEDFLVDSKSSVSKIELAQANLARSKLWLEQVKSDLEKGN